MNNDELRKRLQDYDLADVIAALVELHGRIPVADAMLAHMPKFQPPVKGASGHLDPTEGWVLDHWPT